MSLQLDEVKEVLRKAWLQASWDECLIKGWDKNISMNQLLSQFILIAKPEMYDKIFGLPDLVQPVNYVTSLELKRCRDFSAGKRKEFRQVRGGVRAFVYDRAPQLSRCLWAGVVPIADIIKYISRYKWSPRKPNKHIRPEKTKRRLDIITTHFVKLRELSKNHDWKTVK